MARLIDPPLPLLFKGGRKGILERINQDPPVLFDGALGSRLMQMGLAAGSPPEAWVLERPEAVEAVHREYAAAGSEVLAAVTFGGNRVRLKKCGLEDHLEAINGRAAEIARRAAGDRLYVAGDLGPTGEFFQPLGSLTPGIAEEIYSEQAHILARAGVDFFLLETFYDLREALICLSVCRTVAPQIPAAASLTFKKTKRGFFTEMGDPAGPALAALHEAGAFLVGANCTLEAQGMAELAESLLTPSPDPPLPRLEREEMRLTNPPLPPLVKGGTKETPLLFQPNAGTPQVTPQGIVYPQKPEEFVDCLERIIKLGARAVGGCCGTDGNYIDRLNRRLHRIH